MATGEDTDLDLLLFTPLVVPEGVAVGAGTVDEAGADVGGVKRRRLSPHPALKGPKGSMFPREAAQRRLQASKDVLKMSDWLSSATKIGRELAWWRTEAFGRSDMVSDTSMSKISSSLVAVLVSGVDVREGDPMKSSSRS